jgi:two-component system cell cycle sensor histidine kinase/response regulator CckA
LKKFLIGINLLLLALLSLVFGYLYATYDEEIYYQGFRLFSITLVFIIISFAVIELFRKFPDKNAIRENVPFGKRQKTEGNSSWNIFFEDNPIPSVIFDEDHNIIRKNQAFSNLEKKYKIARISNLEDAFESNYEIFPEAADLGYKKSSYNILDISLKSRDNNPFTLFAVPINDDNYSVKTALAQFIDNSEKSDLKEQFIQAQKMQAIGQLAGGVAHDFNNLLTAILGFCDLLLTRHAPGDTDFVDIMQIKQNANRAANLVRQLLAFSRKQTMQMQEIDLADVMSEISNLIRRLIGENISLNVNLGRTLWKVKADRAQLEQVLINLAVNARDAIGEVGNLDIVTYNKEFLSVRELPLKYSSYSGSSEELKAGKYVIVSIEDDGCGISKENLSKIFEPFFTTKEVGQGTGLGLATVTGIVEQTGGYIFVSSEVGKGSQFLILLPKYEGRKNEKPIQKEDISNKTTDLTGTGTILIVEDEEPVRMFSSRALRNKGYKILEAYSGENALDIIDEQGIDNIDVIISDVVMPGISGPEFADAVTEQKPDVKIIFVSGYGEDAFYEKYGTERKFNFLPKPYSLNQLAAKVKDLMS